MNQQEANQAFFLLSNTLKTELEQLDNYVRKSLELIDTVKVESNSSIIDLQHFLTSDEGAKLNEGLKFSFQAIHISPFIVKHSVFVSVYSFLEYSLKIISQFAAYQQQTSVRKVNNFEKLYQHFDFLTNEMGLGRGQYQKDWELLNVFRDIRNSIMHHNSTIGKNISVKTLEYLRGSNSILLEDSNRFQFRSNEIIFELISLTQRMLKEILKDYSYLYIKNHQEQ